jgi:DsbC/DsbD-like thiol-disulfide interchange protein
MIALMLVLAVGTGSLQRPSEIVKWSAAVQPVSPGGTLKISLTAKIEKGWKLYATTQPPGGPKPLAIEVASGAPFTISAGQIAAPKPKTMKDETFDLETLYYEGEATFILPLSVSSPASGKTRVPLEITFQACGNGICLRPFTEKVNVPVEVK